MSFNLQISELIYLFAAFQGVFLASLILLKRPLKGNVFLFFLILLFTFYLVENVIYSSGYIRHVPHLYFTTLPLIYLIGPLFYLYIRSSITSDKPGWIDLIHLAPFLFEFIILLPFYLLDAEIKVKVYDMTRQVTVRSGSISIYLLGYLIYIFSTSWYFLKSLKLISSIERNNLKFRERRKYDALRSVSIGFFIYLSVSLLLTGLSFTALNIKTLYFHLNLTSLTLLIYTIGYVAFLSPSLFEPNSTSPEFAFDPKKQKQITDRLKQLMVTDKPYLRPDISAREFSDKLGISNFELSQFLNRVLKTSFYDMINEHRIEHSKTMLVSKAFRDAKIYHIALDSGFSNKSSFLRNFKKSTGLTPTEFKRRNENQVTIN